MRQWTDNQLDAITARGGSIIVSAAAGSGKTAVLTERVVRMITEDGIDADRILVVTYTKAAAAEVKGRIRSALSELVRQRPSDPALLRQQALLSKAHISTVDSFFSSVVKEFFYLLNIDRNFRIADAGELNLMKEDALNLTLDTLYTEGDPKFLSLVDFFSSARDDRALCDQILRIYDYTLTLAFPERWMSERLYEYENFSSVADSVFGRMIRDYLLEALDYLKETVYEGMDTISLDEKLFKKLMPLFEEIETLVTRLKEAAEHGTWDDIHHLLTSFSPSAFPRGLKNTPLKVSAKADRDACLDVIKRLSDLYKQDELSCLYDIEIIKDQVEQLFRAVSLFSENLTLMKEKKGVADFSDLSHWMIRLVTDERTLSLTDTARELSERFDEILIDEFQDANDIQDTIFKAISKNEENLFVVGDVKQSIYTFRQARPELFIKRKDSATLYDRERPVFPAKIILEKNFRSAEDILSASNFFFSKLMSRSVGDIDYNEEEMLYPGRTFNESASPRVELDVLNYLSMEESDPVEAEAAFVAKRILELTQGEGENAYELSDIAVLMRKERGITPVFAEVFSRYGIRTDTMKSGRFLESIEIVLIMNLLRVINNPALDIELLSVLMSPVFGFDEDDMARIRLGSKGTTLYAALVKDSERGGEKSARFLRELSYLRDLSVSVPLSELLTVIDDRLSFDAIIAAVSDSPYAAMNLRVFFDHARAYERNTRRGLSAFISYIDRLMDQGVDLKGAPSADDPGRNAVTLMSIHSSKGLEFPVCFLSNTSDAFITDSKENVLLHPDYGIAMKRRDTALNITYNTMPRKALALEIQRAERSEELRILYVGMTRAKEKLIMTSSYRYPKNYLRHIGSLLSSSDTISPFVVRSVNKSSDWIILCAMLHKDGACLREAGEAQCSVDMTADFPFSVNLIDAPLYRQVCGDTGEPTALKEPEIDEEVIRAIRTHAQFTYPYEELLKLPVKVAASGLSHQLSERAFERILRTPAFLGEEKLSAADRGTALHAFMQYTDFKRARADIGSEIERLQKEGYLTEVQAQSIDIKKANAFIRSSVADRCLKSPNVYKEYRFAVNIPAFYVMPDIGEAFRQEPVVLQGAVDLAFEENGAIVIVDYKTDRVGRIETLRELYASQLLLYKRALEECLRKPVSQCLIYSVHLSEEIIID